ncbi:MAG: thymidine kinase [Fimbriimonadaceae bacterium]|jgi:thymidine kinase|nr:thymidine kinase [Fimbriimonadaceae bacterium]
MKPLGKLTVVCGSMFAGKSEELIRLARRALYAKRKIQVFKPSIDDRYHQTMVVSHQGISFEAETVNGVNELRKKLQSDVQMVLIEEVQFFDISIVELCVELADKGVEVIVAGLDQDFRRQPFGPMASLLIAADEVVKLRAICMKCGQTASHTYRMVDGKPARWDDPIVLIGATESYEARCRNCFEIRKSKKK